MLQHEAKLRDKLAKERTTLAVQRTVMGADRSLMAWIRTGLSMIAFGFTIYKFLQGVRLEQHSHALLSVDGPRKVGLLLIGLGTASVIVGSIEHWSVIRGVREDYPKFAHWRYSLVVAFLVIVLGSFLFVSLLYKLVLL